MKIVYLIGNGFDLKQGLKTRYTDFYKYYISLKSSDEIIAQFKRDIKHGYEYWADLEIALGQYSKKMLGNDAAEEYISILDDVQNALANYIEQEVPNNYKYSDKVMNKLVSDLCNPYKYFSEREKTNVKQFWDSFDTTTYEISLMVFNYTDLLEKITGYESKPKEIGARIINGKKYPIILKSIEHIHGTPNNSLLLGVNDSSQILNDILRNNNLICSNIVKSIMNRNAGTMRDERCKQMINDANLICIYGMSLGETDKNWWRFIAQKLVNTNTKLVLFVYDDGKVTARQYYKIQNEKDLVTEKFLKQSGLTEPQKQQILNNIVVCINNKMFDLEAIIQSNSVA